MAFAEDAGIAKLGSFGTCMNLPVDSFPRIAEGLDYVDRFQVSATPTLYVNGKHVSRSRLAETVREVLASGG